MRNFIALALFVMLFATYSCGDDENIKENELIKGDNMTTEQIIGKYELYELEFDNGDHGLINEKVQLVFKEGKILEEFNPKTLKKKEFSWSYKDGVISFSTSSHGSVQGWFKNSSLKYKTEAKPEYPNIVGTYTYRKIISGNN